MTETALVEKFNALEGAVEYVVPHAWNSGHVAHRLIQGFEVLRGQPGAVGPKQFGNGWPVMLQEFSELGDEEAKMYARDAFAANVRPRFTSDEIALANEALGFAWRFLSDHPQRADAIQIWAWAKAGNRSLTALLRARSKRAAAAARLAMQRENWLRDQKRRAFAAKWSAWANTAMAMSPSSAHETIRQQANASYLSDVANLPLITITPHETCPGRILTRTTLDRHLQPGLEALSRRLTEAGVPCR